MMTFEPGQQEIETVLAKLNSSKANVGSYISHNKTDDGDYIVTLSNGRLRLYYGEVTDADKLLPYRCNEILARFRPAS